MERLQQEGKTKNTEIAKPSEKKTSKRLPLSKFFWKMESALQRQDIMAATKLLAGYKKDYGEPNQSSVPNEDATGPQSIIRQHATPHSQSRIPEVQFQLERLCWRNLRHLHEHGTTIERVYQRLSSLVGLLESSALSKEEVFQQYCNIFVNRVSQNAYHTDAATRVKAALRNFIESLAVLLVVYPAAENSTEHSVMESLQWELVSSKEQNEGSPLFKEASLKTIVEGDAFQRLIRQYIDDFSASIKKLLSHELDNLEYSDSIDKIFSLARYTAEFSNSKMLSPMETTSLQDQSDVFSIFSRRTLKKLPYISQVSEVHEVLEVVTEKSSEHVCGLLRSRILSLVEPIVKQMDSIKTQLESCEQGTVENDVSVYELVDESPKFAECMSALKQIQKIRKEGRLLQDIELKEHIMGALNEQTRGTEDKPSHLIQPDGLSSIVCNTVIDMCNILRQTDELRTGLTNLMTSKIEETVAESFGSTIEKLCSKADEIWSVSSPNQFPSQSEIVSLAPQLYMMSAFLWYWQHLRAALSTITLGSVASLDGCIQNRIASSASKLLTLAATVHSELLDNTVVDETFQLRHVSSTNFRELAWGWIGIRVGGEADDYASVADSQADAESSIGGTDTDVGTTPADMDIAWAPSTVSPLLSSSFIRLRLEKERILQQCSIIDETIRSHMLPFEQNSTEYSSITYSRAVVIPQNLSTLGHSLPHLMRDAYSCPMATQECERSVRVETDGYNRITSIALASHWESSVGSLLTDASSSFEKATTLTLVNTFGTKLMGSVFDRIQESTDSINDSFLMQSLFDAAVVLKLCAGERHLSRATSSNDNVFTLDISHQLFSIKKLTKEIYNQNVGEIFSLVKERIEDAVDPVDYSLTEPLLQQLVYSYLSKNQAILRGTLADEVLNAKHGRRQLLRAQKTLQRAAVIKDENNRPRTVFLSSFAGDITPLEKCDVKSESSWLDQDFLDARDSGNASQNPLWKSANFLSNGSMNKATLEHNHRESSQLPTSSQLKNVTSQFRSGANMLMSHVGSYFKEDSRKIYE